MMIPRFLGFIALFSLVAAAVLGRRSLRLDPGFLDGRGNNFPDRAG
jgi:hypothetical protein